MDLKEVELLGDGQRGHWYFTSKARALLQAIGPRDPIRILDVGAGSGFFSQVLLEETQAREATCLDPGYTNDHLHQHAGKSLSFVRSATASNADLILMMDVIEHVDDDVELVRQFAVSARSGTRFVVSVPAFAWLWSRHDVFLDHRRRYTLSSARQVLTKAGLETTEGFYFFASIFPAAIARRLWDRRPSAMARPKSHLKQHHPILNALLKGLCLAECRVARHNRWFGLTAFLVARKP